MKRLTETWPQKKHCIAGPATDAGIKSIGQTKNGGGTKRLGIGRTASVQLSRPAISGANKLLQVQLQPKTNRTVQPDKVDSKCMDVSFTSSFGADCDVDLINAVNSLEQLQQDFEITKVPSPPSVDIFSNGCSSWKTSVATPCKQVQPKQERAAKPAKRKNSRTRRSSAQKPSLFGETSASSFLSDSQTPTQSPADKRRRARTPASSTKRQLERTQHASAKTSTRLAVKQESLSSDNTKSRKQEKTATEATGHFAFRSKQINSVTGTDKNTVCDEEEKIESDISPATSKICGHSLLLAKHGQILNKQDTRGRVATCASSASPQKAEATLNKHATGEGDIFTSIRSETRHQNLKIKLTNAHPNSGNGSKITENVESVCVLSTKTEEGKEHSNEKLVSISVENAISSSIVTQSLSGDTDKNIQATEASGNHGSLLLSAWGLPSPVLEAYRSQGITTMFPWQAECLTTGDVLSGGNLVYSAPTSAGKTMVAELLVLKRVLETRRKALFILPFVSVTREKMISLQRLYQDAGLRVGGFMGSHSAAGGFHSLNVAVCTIEKGNGLVNRLLEENRMDELGVVVIDELHMVGDSNRGYLLELLLTKVCYMARRSKESGSDHPVQVIGMSATLPNLDLLAGWLDANLYHTDFRPVPLTENIKVGSSIYDGGMKKVRDVDVKSTVKGDDDQIIPLCLETLMGGHSVLIFCPTKAWCEKMAEKIARAFYELLKNPTALAAITGETGFVKASEMVRLPVDQAGLMNVLEQLGRSPVGVDPMLGKVIQYGVAYHHAGLTFDERDIVEGAFRQGLLKVLVATSTLSSGVNLPARRVIVRSLMFGGRVMDTLSYKQMAGRAGRKGVDTEGECILVCKEGEKRAAQTLLQADLPPVTSCLSCGSDSSELSRSMKRAILEVVVSGVASTPDDVARYAACTLLSASLPPDSRETDNLISACLSFLEDNEFVRLQTVSDAGETEKCVYQPTQLGSAVLASSMSPDEGLAVFAELQKARQCFVLSSELHIIYLVTPVYSQDITANLDWYHFYCLWEKLSPDKRAVAKVVGVEEGFLAKAITGRIPTKTAAQARAVAIHRRFYTALALHDLVQEVPLMEVTRRYGCNKGQLQSLMQSAATFAGMVTVFCARLGWSNMELLMAQFQQRLTLGVTRELCDLVRIPLLTGTVARVLFNAGYQTVAAVAHAQEADLENVFRKSAPFQSNKKQDGESEWELEQRRKARCMWLTGRHGLTELEAATAIIEEAKAMIQQELGVHINWQAPAASAANSHPSPDRSVSAIDSTGELSVSKTPSLRGKVSPVGSGQRQASGPVSQQETPEVPPLSSGTILPNAASSAVRSRNALPQRSLQKRKSSGGGVRPRIKSPLLNRRSSSFSDGHSPKESFFGQVVVSPPPLMRKTATRVLSPSAEGCDVDRHSTRVTAATVMESVADAETSSASVVNPVELVATTVASENRSDACCKNSTPRVDLSVNKQIILTPKSTTSVPRQTDVSKVGPGFLSSLKLAVLEANSDCVSGVCDSEASITKQSKSGKTEMAADSNAVFGCFDDSFVLDSQTAHMLSGSVSDPINTEKNITCNVATSTPLHPPSKGESCPNPVDSLGKGVVSCPLGSRVSGPVEQTSNATQKQFSATDANSPYLEPEVVIVNATTSQCLSLKPQTSVPQSDTKLSIVKTPSPSLIQQNDNLDDDLFHSPLLSESVENKIQCVGEGEIDESFLPPQNHNQQTENADEEEDTSCELIAASNYERLAFTEVGLTGDEFGNEGVDLSYQDLCITRTGELLCQDREPEEHHIFVKDPEEKKAVTSTRSLAAERTNWDVNNVLKADYDIQDDLAVAANMSELFSSFVECSLSKGLNVSQVQKNPSKGDADFAASFTNSLTASVLERAMVGDMFSEQTEDISLQVSDMETQVKSTGQRCGKTKKKSPNANVLERQDKVSPRLNKGSHSDKDAAARESNQRSITPQNGDLVPPTPPDEISPSARSSCLRRTPLRACRNRNDNSLQQKSQVFTRQQAKQQKRRSKDKENACEEQNQSLTEAVLSNCTQSRDDGDQKSVARDTESAGKLPDILTEDGIPAAVDNTGGDHNKVTFSCSPPLSQESFTIIDVCADASLFSTFVEEWERQPAYAVSVACERKAVPKQAGGGIGGNFMKSKISSVTPVQPLFEGIEIPGDEDRVVTGLAVSWENHDSYYISLAGSDAGNGSLNDTMAAPPADESISHEQKTQAIRDVLKNTLDRKNPSVVTAYDSKTVYNVLACAFGTVFGRCRDPQIASWLLDPGAREKTLHAMVTNYLPGDLPLLEGIGGGMGYGSLGLSVRSPGSGRMRATSESIIARHLMDFFWTQLTSAGLDKAFTQVEMPSVVTLARMELNGFGFSEEECESQKSLMLSKLSSLEEEAYRLAGHPFSLTSVDDVAQVLYLELLLPVNGDPTAAKPSRTLGPTRRGRGRQKSAFSTSKDILEKLRSFHPLPGVILEWRRISSALTKHVCPLQKEKAWSSRAGMFRIFGECQLHTATGRVSLSEPNLQNIPRDFEITLPDVIGESPPAVLSMAVDRHGKRASNSRLQTMRGVVPQAARLYQPATAKHMAVSMRHAFIPFEGGAMVGADYSQLELRVIAHLSGDRKLTSILNEDGDVFKLIAAQWKNTLPEAVTAEQRQQAKQVCYGMLYGIGPKALGEQLGVEENDAAAFIETFKARYTGMRTYLRQTVEKCREQGYVTTLTGRRRYLPAIKDVNPHARAQAERQAVNTTVQGSAADIVKAAMNRIDRHLAQLFPDTRRTHRDRSADAGPPCGAFLVLQLHDELIYEVSKGEVRQVARIIQQFMEQTTRLSVRLPVKVKVGPSWGLLEEL